MKKPSQLLIVIFSLFSLLIVITVITRPDSTSAQTDEKSSGDPNDESPVVSIQMDQIHQVGITGSADGFVYALRDVNGGGNQIYGFEADALTGALTALPGFPITTGGLGTSNTFSELMAYDPVFNHLYVVNNGSDSINAYVVNRIDGSLTELPYSPFAISPGFKGCIAIHPSGSPLIVGNASDSNVASYNIATNSVSEATGSPFGNNVNPASCTFSENGSFVYTGGNSGSGISGFSIDAASGVLATLPGSPFASGTSQPIAYATDASGRFFSASGDTDQIVGFTTNSGIPTGVSGNPFTSGLIEAAQSIMYPTGFYMVADRIGNQVGVYKIEGSGLATTLTAVPGSPFASGGDFTDILALSRTTAFLFAANGDSRNITTYAVNAATGMLTISTTQPVNSLGNSGRINGMAFVSIQKETAPQGGFVYSLQDISGNSNQVHGFGVDSATGTLYQLPGFPIPTGSQGTGRPVSELMAYDEANSRLFVVNNGSDTVSVYRVNRAIGSLTELPYSPFPVPTGSIRCITVHPSGSPLVIGYADSAIAASFKITSNSATQATGSPFNTGAKAFSCTFSQDGAYVYTGGDSGDAFSGLEVDTVSGVLTPLSGSPYASGAVNPLAYSTDASGRLFSANHTSGQIRGFTTSSGVPAAVSGNPFPSGLNGAIYSTIHPAGYFMVADRIGNQVGVYEIKGSGSATTLMAVPGSPFASGGLFTDVLALNEDGQYLFAANGNSRNITSFFVDKTDGSLTGASIQPAGTMGETYRITGMAYVPPLGHIDYLPVINSD